MEELSEQSVEEQEKAQAAVIGRDIDDIPIVEGGIEIDFTKYEGMRFRLASVIEVEVIDPYTGPVDSTGKPSYNPESKEMRRQIWVETESFPKLDDTGQRTSELLIVGSGDKERKWTCIAKFNLKKTVKDNGDIAWEISKAPSAKLWKFMRKLGANKPSEMKDKLVTITTIPDRDKASDMKWPTIVQ